MRALARVAIVIHISLLNRVAHIPLIGLSQTLLARGRVRVYALKLALTVRPSLLTLTLFACTLQSSSQTERDYNLWKLAFSFASLCEHDWREASGQSQSSSQPEASAIIECNPDSRS